MTSRQHARTGPQGSADASTRGAVCFEASPVFGYLAPSDGADATVDQEVLSLFAEPPARSAVPDTGPPGPGPEEEPGPVPVLLATGPQEARRRTRRRAFGWLAVCAMVVCAASAAVLYGLVGAREADRVVTVEGPLPTAPATPPAVESSVAPDLAPSPTATATASASATPTPAATPSAAPTPSPSATPSEAARAPSASPTPAPPPARPSRKPEAPSRLSVGSTGPAVAELQRRLDQVHVYHGPYDGVYDDELADAVYRFQWIRGVDDEPGVYGPATREALVAETSGAGDRDGSSW
ncbi:peptidoglycan-binding protein [Streptomyces sp. DH8]|uniref:peptidoglycan-binding domain-containing protein n=1 Tax=Streptomyces sp. DH8 TaxID=2857008 RepID=UPI001E298552|nr:peptidoglycan-binding domain-containing protein [Streptomyces sp. DH8]